MKSSPNGRLATPSLPQSAQTIQAVLFDLDGTLIDSAPDLAFAVQCMQGARGLPRTPGTHLRHMAGSGARGMLGAAFGIRPASPCYGPLKDEFFTYFEAHLTERTTVFSGVHSMLDALHEHGLPWGIVTNKAERFAKPTLAMLTEQTGLFAHCATCVGGDSTPHTKPHPAPLLLAAQGLGIAAHQCVYAGDDERDVRAGRAAGMQTVACNWGYLGKNADISTWGADHTAHSPQELLKLLLVLAGRTQTKQSA